MPDRLFRPSPRVRASISDDGLVLLDVDGGVVLASNPIGARIWRLIEDGCAVVEIVASLRSAYGVPRERVDRDVRAFVAALEARGLIVRRSR